MSHRHETRGRRFPDTLVASLIFMGAVCIGGCKTPLDVSALKNFGKPDEKLASIDDTRGPLQRILQAAGRGRDEAARRNYRPAAGVLEYEQAEELFQAGEFKKAEKKFKGIAKTYPDSQVEEDALFMVAESRYELKRYSWAQDGYDALMKKYPSTRYMNQSTQRLFTIARNWLEFPEIVTTSDIQQVNFESPQATPPPQDDRKRRFQWTRAVPILPNFIDRSRPIFDTEGRALQALKSIWLNDPTGPLADDALMLTASYHLRNSDYMEADRVYKIIREQYPNSQHLENAFLLGSHVRLMSYQGTQYDGKALDEAEQLKESTLRIFPDTRDRARIRDDLRKIEETKAQRDWETVEFYEKKRKPQAVAVYCWQIIKNHPETSFAQRAREKLDQLQAEAARRPSFGNNLLERVPRPLRRSKLSNSSEPPPAEKPSWGQSLLRRVPQAPKLWKLPTSNDSEPKPAGRARL